MSQPPFSDVDRESQIALMNRANELQIAGMNRMKDLMAYTVQILKTTLNSAATTYKLITIMNAMMFAVGLGLFVTAAVYAAVAHDAKIYSLVFGGLGVASFVAIFLTGSIDKTQTALSNLVQVEVAFMDFFEQISFWEAYAQRPTFEQVPGAPQPIQMVDPDKIREASEHLQARARETIELLQRFVEPDQPALAQKNAG